MNETSPREEVICYICRESSILEDNVEDTLISPCLCSGSSRWVHRACLNFLLDEQLYSANHPHCQICLYPYKLEPRFGARALNTLIRAKDALCDARDMFSTFLIAHGVVALTRSVCDNLLLMVCHFLKDIRS